MAAKTILILGGGVGGIVTANALRRQLDAEHRIVVVDKRAERILQQAAGVDAAIAKTALEESGYAVKPALVMLLAAMDLGETQRRLAATDGDVRGAADNVDARHLQRR